MLDFAFARDYEVRSRVKRRRWNRTEEASNGPRSRLSRPDNTSTKQKLRTLPIQDRMGLTITSHLISIIKNITLSRLHCHQLHQLNHCLTWPLFSLLSLYDTDLPITLHSLLDQAARAVPFIRFICHSFGALQGLPSLYPKRAHWDQVLNVRSSPFTSLSALHLALSDTNSRLLSRTRTTWFTIRPTLSIFPILTCTLRCLVLCVS